MRPKVSAPLVKNPPQREDLPWDLQCVWRQIVICISLVACESQARLRSWAPTIVKAPILVRCLPPCSLLQKLTACRFDAGVPTPPKAADGQRQPAELPSTV